jgi:hypothetical protein
MLTTRLFLEPMLRVGWNWTFVSGRLEDLTCNCHKCPTLNYHVCSVLRSCAPASSESAPLLRIGLLFVEVFFLFICINLLQAVLHQIGIPGDIYRGCTVEAIFTNLTLRI